PARQYRLVPHKTLISLPKLIGSSKSNGSPRRAVTTFLLLTLCENMTTGNITLTRLTVVVVAQNDSQKLLDTMDRLYHVTTDDTLPLAKSALSRKTPHS